MKLNVSLIRPGCAQGKYMIKAKGFILAVLRWGNSDGPLEDWSPIAYVPIDPAGNGEFYFPGRRAIPPEATHVWAQCVSADFSHSEDISVKIPEKYCVDDHSDAEGTRLSVLTDLHLAAKPWKIRQALRSAEADTILLLGDSTNDGLPEQFEAFSAYIDEDAGDKIVLAVPGNHDILRLAHTPEGGDGAVNYAKFQDRLLARAEAMGVHAERDRESLAWTVQLGGLDIIGLQCVTTGRKFLFPEGRQLDWLETHLKDTDAAWHIILCHAPLLAHNPNRNTGAPYLGKNKRLQELVDRHGRILFLSGHTHISPNNLQGNGEYDEKHGNIYLDCGSVVPTDTGGETGLMSPDWKDGCITELSIREDAVEICMRSIASGKRFSRGYYRYATMEKNTEGA